MLLLKSSVLLFIKNIKCRNLRTKVEAFFRFSKIMGLKKVTSKVSTNNKKDRTLLGSVFFVVSAKI